MRHSLLVLAVLLAACSDPKPPEAKFADALPLIPAPPNATILNRESGVDAIKVRFSTTIAVQNVALYYRDLLSKAPYNLVSDTKMADSSIAMYAEHPGHPSLWVTISSNGGGGAFVDIAGAKERAKAQ